MPRTTGSSTRNGPARAGTTRVGTRPADGSGPRPAPTTVRLLDQDGVRRPSAAYDGHLADVDGPDGDRVLRRLHEDMVVVRRLDAEATALQRQGELALWPPLLGQEAAQVGSGHALRADDFVFASYREHAVAYVRGVEVVDLVRVWRGVSASGWDPYVVGMATPQVIIGAQALHATGYAMGLLFDGPGDDGTTGAAVAYFGDGAMSQGDVNEAFVFAATYAAPVVFCCQNNQWAISEPVALQTRVPLVDRADGFGIPGVRVDGNDVLAVLAVTRAALERARTGGGPTLIEAVTYRLGPHTTADDPTRYRDPAEVEAWARRDPVARLATYLRSRGALTEDDEAASYAAADRAAATLRAGCRALIDPPALSVFDHVYAEPHPTLAAERAAYARYLAGFADAGSQADARDAAPGSQADARDAAPGSNAGPDAAVGTVPPGAENGAVR